MSTFEIYTAFGLAYIAESKALQLLIVSILLLGCGLLYEAWKRTVQLTFMNDVTLDMIEKTHPHLPSLRVVAIIIVGFGIVLLASIQHIGGIWQATNPALWIILASNFTLAATCAVLAELRWQKAREYILSALLGTIAAFIGKQIISATVLSISVTDSTVTLPSLFCGLLIFFLKKKKWSSEGKLTSILSFLLWIAIL